MRKPSKPQTPTNHLLSALRNISAITKSEGTALETHVVLANNWATATNGIIGIGEKIVEDLVCAPHAELLIAALSKCGESISITQSDRKLTVSSGKFRAQVPFVPIENLQRASPDAISGPLDNRLRVSFETVSLVPEKEETPVTSSVLIDSGSVFATDRTVILESYHGNHLPMLSIPRPFAKLAGKIKKDYKAFGFSNNSFTIWFADDSWIKTQLWVTQWPDVRAIMATTDNMMEVPKDLWEALSAIEGFSDDGWAYSLGGKLCSHADVAAGASFECYGLPPNIVFSIDQMLAVKKWAKKIDFFARSTNGMNCIKVVGDMTRCVIAGRRD